MKRKLLSIGATTATLLAFSVTSVFAHAVVSPKQVGVAAFQDFNLGVPSEKDAATTSVRLLLPAGLQFVSPVVKPGWKVEVKSGPIPSGMTPPKAADGDVADSIPTEIDWTGGNIPSGQKDIFSFSAQVPASPTELDWKVYQGYSDGSTVAWDQPPSAKQPMDSKGNIDFSKSGPYSVTQVVNDLTGGNSTSGPMGERSKGGQQANYVAWLALAVAVISLVLSAKDFLKPKDNNVTKTVN